MIQFSSNLLYSNFDLLNNVENWQVVGEDAELTKRCLKTLKTVEGGAPAQIKCTNFMQSECNKKMSSFNKYFIMSLWGCGVEEANVSLYLKMMNESYDFSPLFPFEPHHTLSSPLLILCPRFIYFHSFGLGRLLQNVLFSHY